MTAVVPDTSQLEAHLRRAQSALSEELDGIRSWDNDEEKARKLAKARRMARLDDIELPEAAFSWAMPKAQQVEVHLSLKLIAGDGGSSARDDPRAEAFRALAQDLIALVPSDTAVQEKLAVGIGVTRIFPASVATETVRGWASAVLPVLQQLADAGLRHMEEHNAVVEQVIQGQRAAMTRAEELSAELAEFKLS